MPDLPRRATAIGELAAQDHPYYSDRLDRAIRKMPYAKAPIVDLRGAGPNALIDYQRASEREEPQGTVEEALAAMKSTGYGSNLAQQAGFNDILTPSRRTER